ncbi:membrane dipeptidase [Paenibacillus sp. JX-17]|uniref:Membrane dipeptidase n=1 Tax=Paenibacillus lacisoli TaxID=3064525 RepID=A0ABT9CAS5_9BACL|nr:membrane dipeptidase [Paenibacillus sp. JX-17]MDO7905754.1 membrane dipeptidase [Paenibacillus sp. JX-17]
MSNEYRVADFHCDVLSKLQMNSTLNFQEDERLDVHAARLKEGRVLLQTFAIYLSEKLGRPTFEHIAEQISIFYSKVAAGLSGSGTLQPLQWRDQAERLASYTGHDKSWALLALEGVDGLEGRLMYVDLCYLLGVRVMGITWNYANWAADGILEQRNGGFSTKGRAFIKRCGELGLLLDVSHLSEHGFWELMELSDKPPIASHSNTRACCSHPRNLTDEQITALVAREGRIGITFVPQFTKAAVPVTNTDLLKHLEHICSRGGASHIMFGSDFDGIETHIQGLEHAGKYPSLIDLLLKHYPEPIVRGWTSGNAFSYLASHLPERPSV